MRDDAAGLERRQRGVLGRAEPFQKHPHLAAAALPHIRAKRGGDHLPPPGGVGRRDQVARAGHDLEFQRAAANGLPNLRAGDQHHRPGLTRRRSPDADKAGPHDRALASDQVAGDSDPS